jgi:hypothetical protein
MKRLLLVSFLIVCIGCNVSRLVKKEELESKQNDIYLTSVKLYNGTILDFTSDPSGFAILRDSLIYREPRNGNSEIIPLKKVDMTTIYRRSTSSENTGNVVILTCAGIVVGIFFLGIIHFPSF